MWPPFTNNERKKSFSLDIVKEALLRSHVKSEVYIIDFDSVISGINKGKYSGSAALWKSKEREENLVFSDAYLENQLILVGKKGSNPTATTFAELKGKRIGVVKGYGYQENLPNDNNIDFVFGESDQDNLEHLLSDKIDFMLVDNLLIQYVLNHEMNNISNALEFGTVPLITKPLYFAISKKTPNADKIIINFNAEIKKMIADGSYNKLLELNWIIADVDGDGTFELVFNGKKAGIKPPDNVYALVVSENHSGYKYYVNSRFYDDCSKVPNKLKVEEPTYSVPKVDVPNDGKIRF